MIWFYDVVAIVRLVDGGRCALLGMKAPDD